jgi:cobalt/nickel transport system permease protein
MIPSWLQAPDHHTVHPDRDVFVDRSIRSFLGLLSRLRRAGPPAVGRQRIDARVLLVSVVLLVLLLSLSRSALFLGYTGALLLVALSLHRGEAILRVLKTSLPVALFTALVMLPLTLEGAAQSLSRIPLKVFFSVVALRLLAENERWESVLAALRVVRVPRLFVLVLDLTTRYLVLLGERSLELAWALKLRSVGRNSRKAASMAGIVGTLLLASRRMAQETYAAMECRCFAGSYPAPRPRGLSPADVAVLALDAATLAVFLLVGMA